MMEKSNDRIIPEERDWAEAPDDSDQKGDAAQEQPWTEEDEYHRDRFIQETSDDRTPFQEEEDPG